MTEKPHSESSNDGTSSSGSQPVNQPDAGSTGNSQPTSTPGFSDSSNNHSASDGSTSGAGQNPGFGSQQQSTSWNQQPYNQQFGGYPQQGFAHPSQPNQQGQQGQFGQPQAPYGAPGQYPQAFTPQPQYGSQNQQGYSAEQQGYPAGQQNFQNPQNGQGFNQQQNMAPSSFQQAPQGQQPYQAQPQGQPFQQPAQQNGAPQQWQNSGYPQASGFQPEGQGQQSPYPPQGQYPPAGQFPPANVAAAGQPGANFKQTAGAGLSKVKAFFAGYSLNALGFIPVLVITALLLLTHFFTWVKGGIYGTDNRDAHVETDGFGIISYQVRDTTFNEGTLYSAMWLGALIPLFSFALLIGGAVLFYRKSDPRKSSLTTLCGSTAMMIWFIFGASAYYETLSRFKDQFASVLSSNLSQSDLSDLTGFTDFKDLIEVQLTFVYWFGLFLALVLFGFSIYLFIRAHRETNTPLIVRKKPRLESQGFGNGTNPQAFPQAPVSPDSPSQ